MDPLIFLKFQLEIQTLKQQLEIERRERETEIQLLKQLLHAQQEQINKLTNNHSY